MSQIEYCLLVLSGMRGQNTTITYLKSNGE